VVEDGHKLFLPQGERVMAASNVHDRARTSHKKKKGKDIRGKELCRYEREDDRVARKDASGREIDPRGELGRKDEVIRRPI